MTAVHSGPSLYNSEIDRTEIICELSPLDHEPLNMTEDIKPFNA